MAFFKDNSYYLLVGVGQREMDNPAMATSARDAEYMKRALTSLNLFSREKIAPLLNENATKSEITSKLNYLVEATKNEPADFVVIYFSGHGSKAGDKYYLICRDTVSTETALDGTEFVDKLLKVQCDKMLVLLDCCHSQGITDPGLPSMKDTEIPFDTTTFLKSKNKVVLTASSRGRLSYLSNPVSLFTYAVIEGLGGRFLEEDEKEVNLFNFAMNVRERVATLSIDALRLSNPQQPQLNVLPDSSTTNFPLAVYPKGGPQDVTILDRDLTTIKSIDGKDIDLTVGKTRDEEQRKNFFWLSTRTVQVTGNNAIINNGDGSFTVMQNNINNGLSDGALKDVIRTITQENMKIFDTLLDNLKQQRDSESQQLFQRVKNVNSKLAQEKKYLEEQLELLLEKRDFLAKSRTINSDPGRDFSLKKSIEALDSDIDKIKASLNI